MSCSIDDNNEMENILLDLAHVLSIDIPAFYYVLQQQNQQHDNNVSTRIYEILSKISRCLICADGFLVSATREEETLTVIVIEQIIVNCQKCYSSLLSVLFEASSATTTTTITILQTMILDCLMEQTFTALTWKKTRQVILDCIPSLYSYCCLSNNNSTSTSNSSIVFEALKQVLDTDYTNTLVPILSCLFSHSLFLEEAILIAKQALHLDDGSFILQDDYLFLIQSLIHNCCETEEVSDIAQHIHNKLTTTSTVDDKLDVLIGILISDLIVQPCHTHNNKLIIEQGFAKHVTRLLQQTIAHWTIPDICAILSLFYISNNAIANNNYNDIRYEVRHCWNVEMKENNNNSSSSFIILIKDIQQFLKMKDDKNNSATTLILLQSCAEFIVWMLIMTSSTTTTTTTPSAATRINNNTLAQQFFYILKHLFVKSVSLQSWIVETFLSLSSPILQAQLHAACSDQEKKKRQQQQLCIVSLDFLIFLLEQHLLSNHQIHNSAITALFMDRLVDFADNKNNNNIPTAIILNKTCYILSHLLINNNNNNNNNNSFLIFLQKLFFNHYHSTTSTISTKSTYIICKRSIGILLSTHLIQRMSNYKNYDCYDDMSCIVDWTCQVLHSTDNDTANNNENIIGIYGCYFLAICGIQQQQQQQQQNNELTAIHRKSRTKQTSQTIHFYNNHCKELLASTGLIQLEETLIATNNNEYILGYGNLYGLLQENEHSAPRRPLVLCACDLYLSRCSTSDNSKNNANNNNRTPLASYVFHLIDTYLTLGRKCSPNWAPLSWLTMKIQLPKWPLLSSNDDKECVWQIWSLGLDNTAICDFSSNQNNPTLDDQQLEQIAWIGCISLSAILAILHHAHDSLYNNNNNSYNTLLWNHLIQFQFARFYSVEIVIEKCCHLLLLSKKRKKTTKKNDFLLSAAQVVGEIRSCLNSLKLSYLKNISILCATYSIVDNNDNDVTKKMVAETKATATTEVLHATYLRISLLESLAKAILLPASSSSTHGDDPTTFFPFRHVDGKININNYNNETAPDAILLLKDNTACMVSIVESTRDFIPWLCRLRRMQPHNSSSTTTTVEENNNEIISLELATRLVAAHYDVIRAVLLLGRRSNNDDHQASIFPPLFVTFVRATAVTQVTASDERSIISSNCSLAHCLERVFVFFSKQLSECEDGSLATQLIDILSLLTYGLNKAKVTKDLIWKAIHTIYPTNLDNFSVTDSRRMLMEKCVLSSPLDLFYQKISHVRSLIRKKSKQAVVDFTISMLEKVSTCTNKRSFRHCYVLRHMLISLWILLPVEQTCEYLTKSFLSLKSFVKAKISSDGLLLFPTATKKDRRTEGKLSKDDGTNDDMIPGLTCHSVSPFFDILITTTAGSLVCCLPCGDKALGTSSSAVTMTPYRDIQNLVSLLIGMINFVLESCKVFSKETLASVLRICATLVKSMEWQLSVCIEWRNTRPLLTEEEAEAGYVDLASVSLLQPLIDSYASCAGAIAAFCDKVRSQAVTIVQKKQQESRIFDVDIEGESWIYASFQKAVSSLLLRCEKFVVVLRATSSAHNLRPPRFKDGVVVHDHDHNINEKKVSSAKAMKTDWSAIDRLDEEESVQHDDLDGDNEDESSIESSINSDSFTAVGWGESDVETDFM